MREREGLSAAYQVMMLHTKDTWGSTSRQRKQDLRRKSELQQLQSHTRLEQQQYLCRPRFVSSLRMNAKQLTSITEIPLDWEKIRRVELHRLVQYNDALFFCMNDSPASNQPSASESFLDASQEAISEDTSNTDDQSLWMKNWGKAQDFRQLDVYPEPAR